jgi:hypothetical protein
MAASGRINAKTLSQYSWPDGAIGVPAITIQSSMLGSMLAKKNPTAHSNGLSSDTANDSATTLFDCDTRGLWNDLPDLAVAFYCVAIKLPDRLFSLGG